jgi:predicted Zn-dependent protease
MRALLFALAVSTVSLGYRPAAEACLNEAMYTLDDATRLIVAAEELLEKGKYAQAKRKAANTVVAGAAAVDWRFDASKERRDEMEAKRPLLEARQQRVIAIAQLRLGNAKDAKRRLAALVIRQPDDPGLLARYAEAKLATGDTSGGAMLVDLETRDLMPDAAGWVALAKVRDREGDAEARDRALTSCKAIAAKAKDCAFKGKAKAKPVAKS